MNQQKIFKARIDLLRQMLHWIRSHLGDVGFPSSTLQKIELASEEALVNVIQHAYQRKEGEIVVTITAVPKSHVEIVIVDQGAPFNPLEGDPSADLLAPLDERRIGGLGILFMKQYMDEIYYERKKNQNVLTLVKRVRSGH